MGKLEVIEGKQTNWGGLWWHPECQYFSSQALSLAELRKFKGHVRLYVKKNRIFNGGENKRPNYVFSFRDAKTDTGKELAVFDIDEDKDSRRPYCEAGIYYTETGDRLYTWYEACSIIEGAFYDAKDGITDPSGLTPEDYVK